MTIFLIISGVLIFIIYLFLSDKKEVKSRNLQRGGLIKKFPNFVTYSKQAYTSGDPYLQFVKDDGQYIEYRLPVRGNNEIAGYYHLGIQNSFGTYAYVFAINSTGRKINGFIQELHNGRNNSIPEDRSIEDYEEIFDTLIIQMEKTKDFEKLFYGYTL